MKHPCGKEFDILQTLGIRDETLEFLEITKFKNSLIKEPYNAAIKFPSNQVYVLRYMPCGHNQYDHEDHSCDLVNVEEEKGVAQPAQSDVKQMLEQIKYYSNVVINIQKTVQRLVDAVEDSYARN